MNGNRPARQCNGTKAMDPSSKTLRAAEEAQLFYKQDSLVSRQCPSPSENMSDLSLDSAKLDEVGEIRTRARGIAVTRTRILAAVTGTIFCLFLVKQWYDGESVMEGSWFMMTSTERNAWRRTLPQSIVIGVRKCGTRALLEFLSLHPQVRVAPDEVHFFDKEEHYSLGLEWYRKQMPTSLPNQVTMEKSPAYFISPGAPLRIHHMNSSIRLLVIIRDPITRVLSDYTQVFTKRKSKNVSAAPFEDLVIDPNTGQVNLNYKPVQISLYHHHWIRWSSVFDNSQIHIVDGDQLILNPLPELLKVEKFLGLQPFLSADNFYYNQTRGFYCMRNASQYQRCLGSSKGRPHPQVNDSVMSKLRDFYRPHNHIFFDMVQRQFNWTM